jgi:hypothetical protein
MMNQQNLSKFISNTIFCQKPGLKFAVNILIHQPAELVINGYSNIRMTASEAAKFSHHINTSMIKADTDLYRLTKKPDPPK